MKIMVNLLVYIMIIIEYLSFYYVIFGKRGKDRKDIL